MHTRPQLIRRGLVAAFAVAAITGLTAVAAAQVPSAMTPPTGEAHQVGSQSFAFSAGNAAAYQQLVNQYVWNTTVEENNQAAAAAQQAAEQQQAEQQAAAAQQQPRQVHSESATPAQTYRGSSAGSVNGYPCGGDLPPCYILQRESGGNPTAQNPRSTASGLWQFLDSTWNGFGGYSRAMNAPPSVQNEKAAELWAGGAGCSHWAAC